MRNERFGSWRLTTWRGGSAVFLATDLARGGSRSHLASHFQGEGSRRVDGPWSSRHRRRRVLSWSSRPASPDGECQGGANPRRDGSAQGVKKGGHEERVRAKARREKERERANTTFKCVPRGIGTQVWRGTSSTSGLGHPVGVWDGLF